MKDSDSPAVLLGRSAKLKLFVMLRRTVKPEILTEHLGAHLSWMIEREKEGVVFLSGPVTPQQSAAALDGLTLLRAGSMAQAEETARQDPFVQNGVVSFEMREWTVFEGSIPLFITSSDSTVGVR